MNFGKFFASFLGGADRSTTPPPAPVSKTIEQLKESLRAARQQLNVGRDYVAELQRVMVQSEEDIRWLNLEARDAVAADNDDKARATLKRLQAEELELADKKSKLLAASEEYARDSGTVADLQLQINQLESDSKLKGHRFEMAKVKTAAALQLANARDAAAEADQKLAGVVGRAKVEEVEDPNKVYADAVTDDFVESRLKELKAKQ